MSKLSIRDTQAKLVIPPQCSKPNLQFFALELIEHCGGIQLGILAEENCYGRRVGQRHTAMVLQRGAGCASAHGRMAPSGEATAAVANRHRSSRGPSRRGASALPLAIAGDWSGRAHQMPQSIVALFFEHMNESCSQTKE